MGKDIYVNSCTRSKCIGGMNLAKIYQFRGRGKKMAVLQMTRVEVLDVAKAFLNIQPMTHKKLQKLSYYAYSWYYTLYGEKLFRTKFQAWVHGPVSPELYQEYKQYGWREIEQLNEYPISLQENPELIGFIHQVFDSYGHLDADELEYLTHIEDPWKVARGDIGDLEPCTNEIDDEVILKFYRKVSEDGQQE